MAFYGLFPCRNELFQHPPVSAEGIVNVPYEVVEIAVEVIVVSITAVIVAELLVTSALYLFATGKAVFWFRSH